MNMKEKDLFEDSSYDEILDFDTGYMEDEFEQKSIEPDEDCFYRSLDEY